MQYNKVGKGNSFQYVCQYRYAILADMTRPLRIGFAGAFYYITSRGNAKQAIFLHEKDFTDFLGVLCLKVILQDLTP
ncbi:MAG: hypothetical protein WBF68_05485 [Atribacterota bacterium]